LLLTVKSSSLSRFLTTIISSNTPSCSTLVTLGSHLFLGSSVGGSVRVGGRRESELSLVSGSGSGRGESETTTGRLFHRETSSSLLLLLGNVRRLRSVGSRVAVRVGSGRVVVSVDGDGDLLGREVVTMVVLVVVLRLHHRPRRDGTVVRRVVVLTVHASERG
jgi:hypothetical protein